MLRKRSWLLVFALACLGLAHLAGAVTAVFTDQASVSNNTFSTAASFSSCTAGDTGFLNASSQTADSGGSDGDGFDQDPQDAFTNGSGEAINEGGDGDRHR